VKKTFFAILIAAALVSGAVAADRESTRGARPGVVPAGHIVVHPFVNVKEIEAAATKIFVSDFDNGFVSIFNTKGKQLAQITGLTNPQGLAIDAKGNLYIANTGGSDILVYASPYTKVKQTISDSGQYPVGISVLNNGEFIAVSNIFTTGDGPGSVTLYKNGKQVRNVTSSSFSRAYYCGFDGNGNLYIDGENTSGSFIAGEIAKATTTGKTITVLTTKNTVEFPGDVVVTDKGEIAIGDQDAAAVYTYNAPKKGSFGSPTKTTPLTGSGDAVTFAFTSTDKDLWIADAVNLDAAEYAYPKGGTAITSFAVTGAAELIGVAVSPASIPGK
jgi:trimeric autotransporter adhesin